MKMAEEGKKISFGFTKSIKKPTLDKQVLHEKKKVDYIECLDEKAIKVIGQEEKKEEPLIIPLLKSKSWHDRIINKIDADIFKSKTTNKDNTEVSKLKEQPETAHNGNLTLIEATIQIKTEPPNENATLTLDEQAAKEIIEDLKSTEKNEDKLSDLALPLVEKHNLMGAEESTLEDYERIPLDTFGSAMLRGMGWKPGEGIGRNPKVVTSVIPELRPMGMGLGADKITLQKQNGKVRKEEEELRIQKGSFIKIIAGKRSNTYGQIEGFDDGGRLIVKMALSGDTISVNESIVQVVTAAEFSKNRKVLNAAKYEEHKNKESGNKQRSISPEHFNTNDDSDSDIRDKKKKHTKNDKGHKSKKSRKKSKDQQRNSSDSDSERKNRKRRRSSSSDKIKKAKKSKKHKEKDKEQERGKDNVSRHSESSDRRKFNKHTRSRSSSRR